MFLLWSIKVKCTNLIYDLQGIWMWKRLHIELNKIFGSQHFGPTALHGVLMFVWNGVICLCVFEAVGFHRRCLLLNVSILDALKFNICMWIMCVYSIMLSLCGSPTTGATVRQREFMKDALFITNNTFTRWKPSIRLPGVFIYTCHAATLLTTLGLMHVGGRRWRFSLGTWSDRVYAWEADLLFYDQSRTLHDDIKKNSHGKSLGKCKASWENFHNSRTDVKGQIMAGWSIKHQEDCGKICVKINVWICL